MISFQMTLFTLIFTLCTFSFAKAEFCGYYNGFRWYCDDSDTYCCGFRDGSALCCQYNPFYTWWYFWLGIIGFVFFVSLIAALCRRHRLQNERRQLQNRTTAIIQQSVTTAGFANPNFATNESPTAPPPYPAVVVNEQKDFSAPPPAYNPQDYAQFPTDNNESPHSQLTGQQPSG